MSSIPTVPMFSPDGSLGDVPYDGMHDALQAGFKMGVNMRSKDGSMGVIPADKTQEAVKAGFSIVPYNLDKPAKSGGLKAVGSDLKGILTPQALNPYPGMGQDQKVEAGTQALQEAQSRKAAGYNLPYRAAAPIAGIVANVPGMEQSAREGDTRGVVGHAATGMALAATPLMAEGIGKMAAKGIDLLPSTERAGQAFKAVKSVAGDVPVTIDAAQEPALRLMDWQKKTQLGPTINKFLNRVTNPKLGPLSYSEARDYYQLLGKLSAEETMKLAPAIRRDLTQMVIGLKDDIGSTAESVGLRPQYESAMKEYRNAKRIETGVEVLKKYGAKGAAAAVGGGLAGYAIKGAAGQ
jgi:hypothetical protein